LDRSSCAVWNVAWLHYRWKSKSIEMQHETEQRNTYRSLFFHCSLSLVTVQIWWSYSSQHSKEDLLHVCT
jgi:hypothetical protein